jgi:hypothetical protein
MLIGGCSSGSDIAGGSTSTDNAKVVCSVQLPSGAPAVGARARLRPHDFVADSRPTDFEGLDGRVDGQGVVSFAHVAAGVYALELRYGDSLGALLRFGLSSDISQLQLAPATLKPLATVVGSVEGQTANTPQLYAAIAGVDGVTAVDSTGHFELSVPQSDSARVYVFAQGSAAVTDRSVKTAVLQPLVVLQTTMAVVTPYSLDTLAVRTILDTNGLKLVSVGSVARIDSVRYRVVALDLAERDIAVLPDAIGALGACTSLTLTANQLSGLPDSLANLEQLSILNIQNNRFAQLPPVIGKLKNLKTVRCGWNALEQLPSWLGSMPKLETFYAQANKLSALPPELFANAMVRLSVASNQIAVVPPTLFACSTLISLSIADNLLDSLPAGIGSLTLLQELHLNKNRLRVVAPELGALQKLRTLELQDNLLQSLPERFADIGVSGHLRVNGNQLCGGLAQRVEALLDRKNAGWRTTQVCQ